eukprot:scaffold13524_cov109-Isochrysis_galbana.AAC.11
MLDSIGTPWLFFLRFNHSLITHHRLCGVQTARCPASLPGMHRLLHPRTHIPCQPLVGPDQGRPLPLYFRHQAAHFPPRIGRPRLAVWARRVEQGRRMPEREPKPTGAERRTRRQNERRPPVHRALVGLRTGHARRDALDSRGAREGGGPCAAQQRAAGGVEIERALQRSGGGVHREQPADGQVLLLVRTLPTLALASAASGPRTPSKSRPPRRIGASAATACLRRVEPMKDGRHLLRHAGARGFRRRVLVAGCATARGLRRSRALLAGCEPR